MSHAAEGAGAGTADSAGAAPAAALLDIFYGQDDEELYDARRPAHENPAIRGALLASRKAERRLDMLKQCGPTSFDDGSWGGTELPGYEKVLGASLPGYAAGDDVSRGMTDSKARCDGLGAECGGITCGPTEFCTLRSRATPQASPSQEVSYLKEAAVDPSAAAGGRGAAGSDLEGYARLEGVYMPGHPGGDGTRRDRGRSRSACDELGDACPGFTCSRGVMCTVRAYAPLEPSYFLTFVKVPELHR